ncbi:MAG: hypothetical protein ASARMPRED_006131 [Alectoria sarmentosa]|nr:MAG: hypothetical protein ASARMPRED_006131 [Alectoria sarmentosa]
MDPAAYLTNQGWRGDGHALHHSGRGITKPIHISQKTDVLGIGKKQHDAHADQWWARAFDDTLKGLNATKNEEKGKTEGVAFSSGAEALQMIGIGGAKWVGQGGLYSNFVRGESLRGTLIPEEKDHRETLSQSGGQRKRKRGSNDVDITAAAAKDVKKNKKKRRQQEDISEDLELVGVDAVQQKPKNGEIEVGYQKPREGPKDIETKEQRRQIKRQKEANRALEADESRELPEQPRTITGNDLLPYDRPRRRSKEELHSREDTKPVTTRLSKASPDRKRKGKSRKRWPAVDSKRTSGIGEDCV